jgi:hypothetical protein
MAQLQLDPVPSQPVSPQDRIRQLPAPPPPPQPSIPFDQLHRLPSTNVNALSATAAFEPPILRLMRFGEYRLTIVGATSGIELPDPMPAPEGLILDLTDKSPGTVISGGQRVLTMTFRFAVTAARPGNFLMPSYTIHVAGTPVTVPAAQVLVQEPGPADLPYQPAEAALDLAEGEYFVGQMLPARLLLLDTPDEAVAGVANITKPSGDFLFQSQSTSRRENLMWQGKMRSALVTPLRLTPIKAGITEVSLQAILFVTRLNAAGRSSGNTAQALLDTPTVRVTVRPLPEAGRKPGFTGAIGSLALGRATLSSSEVMVGDPVVLTVAISGDGNLEAFGAPEALANDDWHTFPPASDVNRDLFSGRGTKIISYTLIPRRADVRATAPIPFSYFDPERREYIDLTIPSLPVVVRPNPGAAATTEAPASTPATAAAAAPPVEAPPKAPERILTGLAEEPGAWRKSPTPVFSSPLFWAAQMAPLLGLAGLFAWRRWQDFLIAHPAFVRRRQARRDTRRHLRRARAACDARDSDAFVAASIEAIRSAAAPLDSTAAESLVLSEVLARLPGRNGAAATVEKLFHRAHARHFSGHAVAQDGVFSMLPEIEKTVAEIESRQP